MSLKFLYILTRDYLINILLVLDDLINVGIELNLFHGFVILKKNYSVLRKTGCIFWLNVHIFNSQFQHTFHMIEQN